MISEELSGMRREIGQARDLMRDAVEKLLLSFTAISQAAEAANLDEAALARMQREVGVVVTVLQFQDMVDQILGHVLKRVDAIEAAGEGGDGGAAGPTKAKPVEGRHMDAGDVELF
jgi:hypothetical protein